MNVVEKVSFIQRNVSGNYESFYHVNQNVFFISFLSAGTTQFHFVYLPNATATELVAAMVVAWAAKNSLDYKEWPLAFPKQILE